MHAVKTAKYLEEYKVIVTFEDGVAKIVDLSEVVEKGKGVFLPLKDLTMFKQFKVDMESDTIVWSTGADIAPDYLYNHGVSLHNNYAN